MKDGIPRTFNGLETARMPLRSQRLRERKVVKMNFLANDGHIAMRLSRAMKKLVSIAFLLAIAAQGLVEESGDLLLVRSAIHLANFEMAGAGDNP